MAKKQKQSSRSTAETAEPLQGQADRIVRELERTGDALRDDIGKTVISLKENLSEVAKTAAETSTDQLKGILNDVEQLGNRVLEDIGGSLDVIKTKVSSESGRPAQEMSKKAADLKKGRKKKAGKDKAGRKKVVL